MQKIIKPIVLTILIGMASYAAFAEQVTLSTFYPSPYGLYQTISSTGLANFATTSGNVGIGLVANQGSTDKLQVTGNVNIGGNQILSGLLNGLDITDAAGDVTLGNSANPSLLTLFNNQRVAVGFDNSGVSIGTSNSSANSVVIGNSPPILAQDATHRGVLHIDCSNNADCYATYAPG